MRRLVAIFVVTAVCLCSGCGGGSIDVDKCKDALQNAYFVWNTSVPPPATNAGIAITLWCIDADCMAMLNWWVGEDPFIEGAKEILQAILDDCEYCKGGNLHFSGNGMLDNYANSICYNVIFKPEPLLDPY